MKFSPLLAMVLMVPLELFAQTCKDAKDLRLVNGHIHTMDAKNSIVTSVTIQNGRFDLVGQGGKVSRCTKTIDLKGRVAVPGLIAAHTRPVFPGPRAASMFSPCDWI